MTTAPITGPQTVPSPPTIAITMTVIDQSRPNADFGSMLAFCRANSAPPSAVSAPEMTIAIIFIPNGEMPRLSAMSSPSRTDFSRRPSELLTTRIDTATVIAAAATAQMYSVFESGMSARGALTPLVPPVNCQVVIQVMAASAAARVPIVK